MNTFELGNGKVRIKVKKGGKEKTKVVAKEAAASAAKVLMVKLNSELAQNPTSVREVFEAFLDYKKNGRNAISPTSYMRLESTIRNHILPLLRNRDFLDITADDINAILDSSPGSYSSIKKIRDAFGACYKYAVMKGYAPYSPMDGVTINKKDVSEIKILNPQEIEKIKHLSLKRNGNKYLYKYGLIFMFMLNTGLRAGEMCALSNEDIEGDIIKVHSTAVTINENGWKTVVQPHPKSDSSIRYIPLNDSAKEYLSLYRTAHPSQNLVLETQGGNIVKPNQLSRYFRNLLKTLDMAPRRLHSLRDTFASMLIDSGVDLLTVSRLLGHSSSRVTEKHYITLSKKKKMEAVNSLPSF